MKQTEMNGKSERLTSTNNEITAFAYVHFSESLKSSERMLIRQQIKPITKPSMIPRSKILQ